MERTEQLIGALDITCSNLHRIFQQLEADGHINIAVDKSKPLPEAKLAIARSFGEVRLVETSDLPSSDLIDFNGIPHSNDPQNQIFISEAHIEAAKSPCFAGKVGAVVVDQDNQIITRGFNHSVVKGEHCKRLTISSEEVRKLLRPGEWLNFCQAIHDVEGVVASAARDGLRIGGMRWYLSLEPCDRCANALVTVEPEGVYIGLGKGRERYYNSKGIERLLAAEVPVYFVEMEDE